MDEGTPEAPPPELRAVNPAYKGKNGFEPKFTDSVDPNDKHAMRVALDRHRLTERIIATKGRPIPSFEEMQKFVERIKTPATVRESIKELQEEHLEDLQALYDYQAADYIQDTRDFYASWDDTVYLEEGEQDQRIIESYRRLESLPTRYQESLAAHSTLMDEYAEMKHTYFARLQHLRDELEDVEKRDATIRAEQERNFPESVDEFNDLPTEAQQRVAKYLVADKAGQEMMKAKFGWAWRQTVPLLNAFKSNDVFKERILALAPTEAPRKRTNEA